MNLPRNPELAAAERDLHAARETVKVVAKRVQLECEHISVKQLGSFPARCICQSCGLEETGTRGSSASSTSYWSREDYQRGELDNDDARAVEIVSSPSEFYHYRIAQ
jgi:hypothetical protein